MTKAKASMCKPLKIVQCGPRLRFNGQSQMDMLDPNVFVVSLIVISFSP
jgi:hypothetical protein